MLGGLFAKLSKLIDDLMDPLKKHKKVPFDDWAALLRYLTKVRCMLKEVRRLKVFQLFDTVSNIDAITKKLPSDAVSQWMTKCQNLSDGHQGAEFEKFITQEWTYATSVLSRVTSPEQTLKTLGVGSGGGSGNTQQSSESGGARGKFNNWRDKWSNNPWLHCWKSVTGHVGLRVITMDLKKPHKEPPSKRAMELKNVGAGAHSVGMLEL
jgi:hypothetical protein